MTIPRVLAFDLDGTLLGPDGAVSAPVVAALGRARAAGSLLVAATGRPWPQTEPVVSSVGGMHYGVCLNGAVVTDAASGEVLHRTEMTAEQAVESAAVARDVLGDATLGADMSDGQHFWELDFAPSMPVVMQLDRVDDAVAAVNGPVLTWLVGSHSRDALEVVDLLATKMPAGTEIRPSGLDMAEIVVSGVSKASGLAQVARREGFAPSDVMAFGDGLNDLDMLEWAGTAVAMANGAPQALAAADRIAPSNADDGVAAVLNDLLDG